MTTLLLVIIYLSFISLGLPDGLLGAGWPSMYRSLNVPLSYAAIISVIISAGTIISSLMSHRLTNRFGTAKVTAFSVAATALALVGFSLSDSFWLLCLIAIPYGLGAGSVDASLNNYVAVHFESRHMSWLHCFWGVGATIGPSTMGIMLTNGFGWRPGFGTVGALQIMLTVLLFASLPLWDKGGSSNSSVGKSLSLKEIISIKGVKEVLICFFSYCALEQTAMLWGASYLSLVKGLSAEAAASFASAFFIGLTGGRAICGFITMKLSDRQMIRLGSAVIALGCITMLLPLGTFAALAGLLLIGLGCAPIYPCIIHSTPFYFGSENSQAIIGVQMASAYCGTLMAPPVFGFIAENISTGLMPVFIFAFLILMAVMHEKLVNNFV